MDDQRITEFWTKMQPTDQSSSTQHKPKFASHAVPLDRAPSRIDTCKHTS